MDSFTWGHRDMLILFAAGNEGADGNADGFVDLDSMDAPGTAKNALTVGASENLRPGQADMYGDWWPTDFPAFPVAGDAMADDANGMAAFSSRGPTDDGRIKPDIASPGTWVLSTRSHDPNAGTGWGEYNANYIYEGGTSMATPLTAGAAALVREWLNEVRGVSDPSSALLKVLLMNGAANTAPGQYSGWPGQEIPDVVPNNVEGWGRTDLKASIMPDAPRQVWFDDFTGGLATGQTKVYTLTVGVPLPGRSTLPARIATTPNLPAPQPSAPKLTAQPVDKAGLHTAPSFHGAAAPLGVTQLLGNPGFENYAFAPWVTVGDPQIDLGYVHSGSVSAFMGDGDYQDDELQQAVTIPASATAVTIDFWYSFATQETYPGVDYFCYGLWSAGGGFAYVQNCGDFGVMGNVPWTEETYNLTPAEVAAVAGQNVTFAYYVVTDFSQPSTAWVDDSGLLVETPGNTTPTPTIPGVTATPTNTPIPGSSPLRIGLAWTDYPAQPSAGRTLINDLDLEVIGPDGAHYYGNAGAYPNGDNCLRSNQWDQCNNAETVYVSSATPGTYLVKVHAYNVPQGPQPFAVTAWGDYARAGAQPPNPTPTPTSTPIGPTNTPVPPTPTHTPGGPTNTPVPPTPTYTPGGPTNTPVPPSPTPTQLPGDFQIYLPVVGKSW